MDSIMPCPHDEGETFALDLDEIEVDLKSNMRDPDGPDLRELAESMRLGAGIGQLQPVLVAWTGNH